MRFSIIVYTSMLLMNAACSDSLLGEIDDENENYLDLDDFQETIPEGHFEGTVGIDIHMSTLGSPSVSDDCLGYFSLEVRSDQSPEIQGMGACEFQSDLLDYVSTQNEGDITGEPIDNADLNTSSAYGQIWTVVVGDDSNEVSEDWYGGADGDEIYAEFTGDLSFQVSGQWVQVGYVGYFLGELIEN